MANPTTPPEKGDKGRGKPVSLYPVPVPEVIADLLKTEPPPKAERRTPPKKKRARKRKPASGG